MSPYGALKPRVYSPGVGGVRLIINRCINITIYNDEVDDIYEFLIFEILCLL